MVWSVESELLKLSSSSSVSGALEKLFGIPITADPLQLRIDRNWYRSGAETYGLVFSIVTGTTKRKFFMKACCPSSPITPIDEVLQQWIARRSLLERSGVRAPQLYAAGHGLILEEYIEEELTPQIVNDANREIIRASLIALSRALIANRFNPLSPFSNLMWASPDVIWVDFGEDLGPPDAPGFNEGKITDTLLFALHELGV